jgi:hypothetical protein
MPRIWTQPVSNQAHADIRQDAVVERPGIEFLEVGDDVRARVPADTRQPFGSRHGGA